MRTCWSCALMTTTWLAACTGDVTPDSVSETHHSGIGDEEADFEGCPETIPSFSLDMTTMSADGKIEAKLLSASPAPPLRFFNDWTVQLRALGGEPLADLSLRRARAFMPVHGHYGTPDPTLRQHDSQPDVFDINALNLFMRGPWKILLEVGSSTQEAELVFEVCVEE